MEEAHSESVDRMIERVRKREREEEKEITRFIGFEIHSFLSLPRRYTKMSFNGI